MKQVAVIIDDNQNSLDLACIMLQALGWEVITINDPKLIEKIIRKNTRIDIVFLDLEMPTISGFEILKQLRTRGVEAPIIAHTAHSDRIIQLKSAGFSGLLGKPLDMDMLAQFIQDILNGENIWQQ